MGDISKYYRYKEGPNKRYRPNSAGFMGTTKFNSESNLHQADMEQQNIGYQPRHFGSMTSIGDTDDPIPYIDDPCPRVIGRSPHVAEPSPVTASMNNPSPTSTDGSYHSALGSLPSSGNPSPSDPNPSDLNNQKESAFSRLFRSSKRFGSASDLVQKILRKKSDSSLNSHPASRNSSTNHTPPVTSQFTMLRPTTNSATNSKNSSPETEPDKISPSYPPPMRATLSMSQIVSSNENSANNTPDAPSTSFGQRSVSTYNLNQAWPSSRTLQDPFHQGLSQSYRNLRSSQPGLSQPQLGLTQPRLSQSNRGISAYSLNQTGMSEFGSRLMKRSDSATSKRPLSDIFCMLAWLCNFCHSLQHFG